MTAQSSVLFERRAEKYLDPESLAMLGRLLFRKLKKRQGFKQILDKRLAGNYIAKKEYIEGI